MTIRIVTMTGLALLAACGSALVTGSAAQAKVAATAPRALDIASLRPGMKATEVVAVFKRGGWKVETPRHGNLSRLYRDRTRQECSARSV